MHAKFSVDYITHFLWNVDNNISSDELTKDMKNPAGPQRSTDSENPSRRGLHGKAKPTTTLASSSAAAPLLRISYNLVVCGAKNYIKDGPLFSNFMVFCTLLNEKGASGDFLSCFPIERHLVYMKNTKGIDDMKFGRIGSKKAPIVWFSRIQLCARKPF